MTRILSIILIWPIFIGAVVFNLPVFLLLYKLWIIITIPVFILCIIGCFTNKNELKQRLLKIKTNKLMWCFNIVSSLLYIGLLVFNNWNKLAVYSICWYFMSLFLIHVQYSEEILDVEVVN